MNSGLVIVGSGLAGYMLAKEWRKYYTQSPLTIITQGEGDFYSKPLLSTALTQKREPQVLPTSSAAEMAEQLNATILRHTTVTSIDPQDKVLITEGKKIPYDQCVLAVGADVIRPSISGSASEELVSVNSLEQYAVFRSALKPDAEVVILGAGLVGCEFANDLVNVGHRVDLVAAAG
jgi:rubredoxin-NAD+ reductase